MYLHWRTTLGLTWALLLCILMIGVIPVRLWNVAAKNENCWVILIEAVPAYLLAVLFAAISDQHDGSLTKIAHVVENPFNSDEKSGFLLLFLAVASASLLLALMVLYWLSPYLFLKLS